MSTWMVLVYLPALAWFHDSWWHCQCETCGTNDASSWALYWSHHLAVCVCVCVWERERERESHWLIDYKTRMGLLVICRYADLFSLSPDVVGVGRLFLHFHLINHSITDLSHKVAVTPLKDSILWGPGELWGKGSWHLFLFQTPQKSLHHP